MPDLPNHLQELLRTGRDEGLQGEELREAFVGLLEVIAEGGGLDWPGLMRLYQCLVPPADRLVPDSRLRRWLGAGTHPDDGDRGIKTYAEELVEHLPKSVCSWVFRFSRMRYPDRLDERDGSRTRPVWVQVLEQRPHALCTWVARCQRALGASDADMMDRLEEALPASAAIGRGHYSVGADLVARLIRGEAKLEHGRLVLATWRAWGRPCGVSRYAWEDASERQAAQVSAREQDEESQDLDRRRQLAADAEKELFGQ